MDPRQCCPLGLLVGMAMGCWQHADHHCLNLDGDSTCAERGSGSFCDACRAEGDGCTYEQPSEGCHFAGVEQASASMGALDDVGSNTEATTTDGPGSTTDATHCSSDEDCEHPAAPFCTLDGACVGCDGMPEADVACAGRDETRPLCVDGECVQCTPADASECDATLQICDAEMRACMGCTEHEQCGSGACELAAGRCFPLSVAILEVDGDGGTTHTNVGAAVADVAEGDMAIIRVHQLDSGDAYQGAPLIDGGKTIALLAAPGEKPAIEGMLPGNPALRVWGPDTTAYIDRLSLRDTADGRGLEVKEGAAWVDRSRIVGNADGGVLAEGGARVTIRSSFVGGDIDDVAALEVNDATARVVYTTLVGGSNDAQALRCAAAATVEVRNSLLFARTGASEVLCLGTFDHDASEHGLGGTNTTVPSMSTTWFTGFAQGDFHLAPSGAQVLAGVARWDRGDPRTDIDGDARSSLADAFDHAGADVP